jgi:pimeloyl-ACP methyl ester carboxylesterase
MITNRTPRLAKATGLIVAAVLVTGALVLSSNAPADARRAQNGPAPLTTLLPAPEGAAFFTPPTPLPGRPGDVIWARRSSTPLQDVLGVMSSAPSLPRMRRSDNTVVNGEVWQILYHTTDQAGRSEAVSALMLLDPQRSAGAPVLVAMHGWVGFGTQCGIFGSPWRGTLANTVNLYHRLSGQDYVFIVPDATNTTRRSNPTPMLAPDAARLLLDAARSAGRFSGASNRTIFVGASLGGTMALAAASYAPQYAPDIDVRGVVTGAAPGLTGAGTPMFDVERIRASESSTWYSRTIVYLMMLEQSYGKAVVNTSKYLTAKGMRAARRMPGSCVNDMAQHVIIDRWQDLFKKDPQAALDKAPGTLAYPSRVPVYMLAANADHIVDPLLNYHTYQGLCRNGQPTWLQQVDASHGGVLTQVLQDVDSPLLRWITQVTNGVAPDGGCGQTQSQALISYGQTYTGRYLATALGVPVDGRANLSLRTQGACRVRKNVLTVRSTGQCQVQLIAKPRKGAARVSSLLLDVRP